MSRHRISFNITLLAAFALILLSGCTHNNGDIGKIFGTWKMHRAECHGVSDPADGTDMFWSFQSGIVRIDMQRSGHDDSHSTHGNFRIDDNTLFLDFPDTDRPMPLEGIPDSSEWQILRLTKRELTVMYTFTEGKTVTYYFKKW